MTTLSAAAREALAMARCRAVERRQLFCTPLQLLETLLILGQRGIAAAPVTVQLDAEPVMPFEPPAADFSKDLTDRVLPAAQVLAEKEGASALETRHLLAVLLSTRSPIPGPLRAEVARRLHRDSAAPATERTLAHAGSAAAGRGLHAFLRPMALADCRGPWVDRPEILDRLMRVLLYTNPVLVGPVGSGRRTLLRLLARKLLEKSCPAALRGHALFELDPLALVAGTTYRGELEERVQELLKWCNATAEKKLLFVEDVSLLVGTGRTEGSSDIGTSLVPALKSGKLQVAGSVTEEQLRERLEKAPGLDGQLRKIRLGGCDAPTAASLLACLPDHLAATLGARCEPDLVPKAVRLCQQHLPHQALPGAARTVLEEAAATLALERGQLEEHPERRDTTYWRTVAPRWDDERGPSSLGPRDVLLALSELYGIPFEHLDSSVGDKIRGFDAAFAALIFGQDHVRRELARVVKTVLLNLTEPRRPRGRLFFVGPPGTGKSECARLLAKYLMGSEEALLRFDMSEFQEAAAIATLIGADKGLQGNEEGGRLTEPLRHDPHRVLLFDEIEKAHPSVFNIFLQVLDFGEITDKRGMRVSFRHSICVFTSNVGCSATEGFYGCGRDVITKALESVFRPEFLDRIAAFVPFRALDGPARRSVTRFQLGRVGEQILETYGLDLTWDDALVEAASEPPPGAAGVRDILRWIEAEVKPAIGDVLLEHPQLDGLRGIHLESSAGGRVAARTSILGPAAAAGRAPGGDDSVEKTPLRPRSLDAATTATTLEEVTACPPPVAPNS